MKTTIDIPDALYRRVKTKSAQIGTPIRAITISLFSEWVEAPAPTPKKKTEKIPAWFGSLRHYAEKVEKHDMESIRASIAKGRRKEFLEQQAEESTGVADGTSVINGHPFFGMKADESTSVVDEMKKLRGGRCREVRA